MVMNSLLSFMVGMILPAWVTCVFLQPVACTLGNSYISTNKKQVVRRQTQWFSRISCIIAFNLSIISFSVLTSRSLLFTLLLSFLHSWNWWGMTILFCSCRFVICWRITGREKKLTKTSWERKLDLPILILMGPCFKYFL